MPAQIITATATLGGLGCRQQVELTRLCYPIPVTPIWTSARWCPWRLTVAGRRPVRKPLCTCECGDISDFNQPTKHFEKTLNCLRCSRASENIFYRHILLFCLFLLCLLFLSLSLSLFIVVTEARREKPMEKPRFFMLSLTRVMQAALGVQSLFIFCILLVSVFVRKIFYPTGVGKNTFPFPPPFSSCVSVTASLQFHTSHLEHLEPFGLLSLPQTQWKCMPHISDASSCISRGWLAWSNIAPLSFIRQALFMNKLNIKWKAKHEDWKIDGDGIIFFFYPPVVIIHFIWSESMMITLGEISADVFLRDI